VDADVDAAVDVDACGAARPAPGSGAVAQRSVVLPEAGSRTRSRVLTDQVMP
jgi:hypothetical protein